MDNDDAGSKGLAGEDQKDGICSGEKEVNSARIDAILVKEGKDSLEEITSAIIMIATVRTAIINGLLHVRASNGEVMNDELEIVQALANHEKIDVIKDPNAKQRTTIDDQVEILVNSTRK